MRTQAQLDDNLAAADVALEPDELHRLDDVSRVEPGFPKSFAGAALAHGRRFGLVDDRRRTIDPMVE